MARKPSLLRRALPLLVLVILLPLVLFAASRTLGARAGQESLALAEQSVRRAAVQCYALEGRYPPDLDYIRENYGVDPDPGRYTVVYHCFASNLLPEITVLPKEGA